MDFFDTMNYITASWMMPIAGLLTIIFVGWVLKKEDLKSEFLQGTKWPMVFTPWLFFIRWIAPLAVIIIILHETQIIHF
jgi:NSS family neurotransmitter:Na+ symporter